VFLFFARHFSFRHFYLIIQLIGKELQMSSHANFFILLKDSQIEKLHENTLSLLNNPGMKIENMQMLKALQKIK
jgi:hypothetical protein